MPADYVEWEPAHGCPMEYNLRLMGIKVTNRSAYYSTIEFRDGRYNEGLDPFGSALDEEPYLLYAVYNGVDDYGVLRHYSSSWCCGGGVTQVPDYEPDPGEQLLESSSGSTRRERRS